MNIIINIWETEEQGNLKLVEPIARTVQRSGTHRGPGRRAFFADPVVGDTVSIFEEGHEDKGHVHGVVYKRHYIEFTNYTDLIVDCVQVF